MQIDYQEPRKPIRAATINQGVDAWATLQGISVAPGLEASKGKGGLVLRLAAALFDFRIGVTAGSIASGSLASPTSGSITLAKWTGSGFSTSGMPTLSVKNIWSNNSTAIGSGKTAIAMRIMTQWVIIAWDC